MSLRIFTLNHGHRSHARAANKFVGIFASMPKSLAQLVDDPDAANVSYLHTEASNIPVVFDDFSHLRKTYKIGYCVWETDKIPQAYVDGLRYIDEVWTASLYNWLSLSKIHPNVQWVPHVTGGHRRCDPSDVEEMRRRLRIEPGDFCYVYVGHDGPRKNVDGLIRAFRYVNLRRPTSRLIIKAQGKSTEQRIVFEGRTARCEGSYSHAQIAALYGLCDTYVSPHRGEGWGLTLSDAMEHRTLCVATAHSGNLEFMTRANSLLVACTIAPIWAEDCGDVWEQTMSWAYVHDESLEQQMLRAFDLVTSNQERNIVQQAARDIRCFDARHIRVLVRHRLREIAKRLAQ